MLPQRLRTGGNRAEECAKCVQRLKNAQNVYKADISKKMAFLFGNEANGVAEELQAAAETRLFIPMTGLAESMNVAMAAGIILFEGLRQRKFYR